MKRAAAADVGLGGGEAGVPAPIPQPARQHPLDLCRAGDDQPGFSLRLSQAATCALGRRGEACLSRRFVDMTSLDRRHLRMVDMAEQMLVDMGLGEPRSSSHTLGDRVTTLADPGARTAAGPGVRHAAHHPEGPQECPVRSGDPGSGHAGGSPPWSSEPGRNVRGHGQGGRDSLLPLRILYRVPAHETPLPTAGRPLSVPSAGRGGSPAPDHRLPDGRQVQLNDDFTWEYLLVKPAATVAGQAVTASVAAPVLTGAGHGPSRLALPGDPGRHHGEAGPGGGDDPSACSSW